ncbi:MFS transporter [Herbiconiux flava]|uniref:Putative proline/betaine transporter n=1 Tax=Herbiconiux flava TaxID=881268 RepID=A0A852SQC3_9MICO|nr:MFS transporter [Herbiconiux flava]NYD70974.1 MHS family proline/betaine transporter-like MFS transporter [Herbiconiux flava]GLK19065.1 MFS transporter [Herbiconiux flava]
MSSSSTAPAVHDPTTISPRVIAAGAVGSIVEYFDFAVYGYVATILAVKFFAEGDPVTALLSTLATFAVAFVLRPVGALLFGHFGDKFGRKNALALTIILMAAASGLIGILPTYGAIGVGATLLLVLARSLQGLAAGGELGGAASFVAEKSPRAKRGLFTSTTQMGALAGSLIASVTVTVLNLTLGSDVMNDWGWRLPFLIAIPIGLFGLWVRNGLEETEEFKAARKSVATVKQTPVKTMFMRHPGALLRVVALSILLFSAYYVAYVYVNIHMQTVLGFDANFSYLSTTLTLLVSVIAMPFFGALSDRVGRKPVFLGATIAALVLAVPAFLLFEQGGVVAILAHILLGLVDSALMGVALSTYAEMFPTEIRYTGIAFGFSVGAALAGGTAPYICTWLIGLTGNPLAPAFFVIVTALITLIPALRLKETKGIELSQV